MDAMEKAQQIADVAGVTLGSLEYITDSSVRTQGVDPYAPQRAFALAADESAATSISGGELEVSLTVRTAFSIQ